MKRLLLAVSLMLALRPLQAAVKQDFGEHFEVGLLDHIDTMGMWGFQGNDNDSTKLALMDSIVRFGKIKGTSVLDLQVGAFGNVTRLAGERRFPNWISGAQLRVDTLVRGWTLLSEPLAFLSAIEHGLVVYRDFTNQEWFYGYAVGLSFSLKQNHP